MKRTLIKLVLIGIVGGVVALFATGQLRFYVTSNYGGESTGYIGKKSTLLEDEEKLADIFQELSEEFAGKPVNFMTLALTNESILSIIQDPDQTAYYDYYFYDGTRLIFDNWRKGNPWKPVNRSGTLPIEEVPFDGITSFYQKISSYLEEGNHELPDYEDIEIYVNTGGITEGGALWSNIYGERQDFRFEADFDGNDFKRVNY